MYDKILFFLKIFEYKIVQVFKEWKNFILILVLIIILDINKNIIVKKFEDINIFNDLFFD